MLYPWKFGFFSTTNLNMETNCCQIWYVTATLDLSACILNISIHQNSLTLILLLISGINLNLQIANGKYHSFSILYIEHVDNNCKQLLLLKEMFWKAHVGSTVEAAWGTEWAPIHGVKSPANRCLLPKLTSNPPALSILFKISCLLFCYHWY